MKKNLLGILFGWILISQFGCMNSRSFFRNKILIYNSESSSGQTTENATFIDFYKDTINKINYPFNLFEHEQGLVNANMPEDTLLQKYRLPNTYPYSGVPFKFRRRNRSIYITYTVKGEVFERKYFQVSNKDSVKTSTFEYLCDSNNSYNWVVTQFTGEAIIKVSGRKFKCWIFREEYPYLFFPNQRSRTIYLDKVSLLPVQIHTTYYRPDKKNPVIITTELFKSKIDTVFNRPWNSSDKKWNYPKCWKRY